MAATKIRIHRFGEPDVSTSAAWGFALAFMTLGGCSTVLAYVVVGCLFFPLG